MRKSYSKTITTPPFIISYPNLGQKTFNKISNKMEFSFSALIPKDAKYTQEWLSLVQDIKKEVDEFFEGTYHKNNFSLIDCDTEIHRTTGKTLSEKDPAAKGMYKIEFKKDDKNSQVVNVFGNSLDSEGNLVRIDPTDKDEMYGGCLCEAKIQLFSYHNTPGSGLAKRFVNVRRLAKLPPIGKSSDNLDNDQGYGVVDLSSYGIDPSFEPLDECMN